MCGKFSYAYDTQNGRIDNIFTDTYYDPFTSALHEVVKDFKLPVSCVALWLSHVKCPSRYHSTFR